jgi:hypothetical protein
MSRGAHKFKQGDITKALKGTVAAGLSVRRVVIDQKTGNIVVITGEPAAPDRGPLDSEWD